MHIRSIKDALIISDLHLATTRGSGLFRADDDLKDFLVWVRRTTQSTLFLNGDIFDFLTADPAAPTINVFDPLDAPRRARAILAAHREVFTELALLAQSPAHEVVLLSGNHDPELALPAVREAIESGLVEALRNTREATDARPSVRWLVHGEAARINVGAARVLIEHGDALDEMNRINHQTLLAAAKLASRGIADRHTYNPPPGSHLVVNHLNAVLPRYPWADKLKPEWEAVVPLLYEFLDFKQQARLLADVELWLNLVGSKAKSYYLEQFDQKGAYRAGAPSAPDSRQELARWFDEVRQSPRGLRNAKKARAKLIARLRQAAACDEFFQPTAPATFTRDIEFLLRQGADVVVQGHTHAAKAYLVGQGLYLNSGTWGQLLALPGQDADEARWGEFVAALEQGSDLGEARPTFLRVRETDVTRAALLEWRVGAELTLAQFVFEPAARRWERGE
jgi:UDP-2,3-diacylglucosamine pyrophosphatase LpxH